MIGSFTCTCDAGYTGDGTVCTGERVGNAMGVVSPNGCGFSILYAENTRVLVKSVQL